MEQQLFVFNADSINHVEVAGIDETVLLVRGEQLKWNMEKPVQYPADRARIGRVLSELEFAKRIATIDLEQFENPEEVIKQYGLTEPRIELRFRDEEHAYRLSIGNETARKGNYYAQVKSGTRSEFIVISQEIESLIDTKMDGWRSKRIFDFDTTSVTSLRLKNGGADVELVNEADEWLIARPYSGPTEANTVVSYLAGMLAARVEAFTSDDEARLADFGLNTPQVSLEIFTGELSETLNVGNQLTDRENLYYAQVTSKDAVFLLTGELVSQVKELLNRVREKRILTQNLNEVTGLQLQNGSTGWSMTREGEEWKFSSDGKPAEAEAVNSFYTKMGQVKGVEFFEKSEQNRSDFQLTSPELSLAILVPAEEASDAPQPEKYSIRISAAQEGHRYVESDFVGFLVKIPAKAIPLFPPSRLAWATKALELPASDSWKSISWDVEGSTLEIARDANGQWPQQWNDRVLDLNFLQRQIDVLQELEVIERLEVDAATLSGGLVLNVVTEEQQYQLIFSLPADRFSRLSVNADSEGYLIHERDYQLLAVFPLEYGDTESE
ncbi:MAG: DUF4340 domain-containing protein [Gammaproteobacteria bacterium]|nr:DUF4340 domain-containing protein [Gammaproteobacteria bacterium]